MQQEELVNDMKFCAATSAPVPLSVIVPVSDIFTNIRPTPPDPPPPPKKENVSTQNNYHTHPKKNFFFGPT